MGKKEILLNLNEKLSVCRLPVKSCFSLLSIFALTGFPSINSYFWRIRKKDGPSRKENTKPCNNSRDILIDIFVG